MRYKLLYAMLIVAVQLSFCNFMDKDVNAMSSPYLTENYEKDIITNDNAILNIKLINPERKRIDAFEIAITYENVEIIKYQKKVNDESDEIYSTFDVKKDTGKKLDSGKEYNYTVRVVSGESLNESMYTLNNRFTTNSVKVLSTIKNVKKDTALVQLKINNSKKEKIKKIGIKIFLDGKLRKDYYKVIDEPKENAEYEFDLKRDAGVALVKSRKYSYVTYVELDVRNLYLYNALSFDEGTFETLGNAKLKTKVYKRKKIVAIKNIIENPCEEKISGIKIVLTSGKKRHEVYKKRLKSQRKNKTVNVKIKVAKIKRLLKKRKCKYITYVTIGGKKYTAKGKIKI